MLEAEQRVPDVAAGRPGQSGGGGGGGGVGGLGGAESALCFAVLFEGGGGGLEEAESHRVARDLRGEPC